MTRTLKTKRKKRVRMKTETESRMDDLVNRIGELAEDAQKLAQQAVQQMLADMAIQVEAARALVYSVAKTIDSGSKDFTQESAMSKVFASDTAMRVTTDAMQIFGGVGYMRDYPVEKMFRDAKITQIYEGSNQVLRNAIAFELRKKR